MGDVGCWGHEIEGEEDAIGVGGGVGAGGNVGLKDIVGAV